MSALAMPRAAPPQPRGGGGGGGGPPARCRFHPLGRSAATPGLRRTCAAATAVATATADPADVSSPAPAAVGGPAPPAPRGGPPTASAAPAAKVWLTPDSKAPWWALIKHLETARIVTVTTPASTLAEPDPKVAQQLLVMLARAQALHAQQVPGGVLLLLPEPAGARRRGTVYASLAAAVPTEGDGKYIGVRADAGADDAALTAQVVRQLQERGSALLRCTGGAAAARALSALGDARRAMLAARCETPVLVRFTRAAAGDDAPDSDPSPRQKPKQEVGVELLVTRRELPPTRVRLQHASAKALAACAAAAAQALRDQRRVRLVASAGVPPEQLPALLAEVAAVGQQGVRGGILYLAPTTPPTQGTPPPPPPEGEAAAAEQPPVLDVLLRRVAALRFLPALSREQVLYATAPSQDPASLSRRIASALAAHGVALLVTDGTAAAAALALAALTAASAAAAAAGRGGVCALVDARANAAAGPGVVGAQAAPPVDAAPEGGASADAPAAAPAEGEAAAAGSAAAGRRGSGGGEAGDGPPQGLRMVVVEQSPLLERTLQDPACTTNVSTPYAGLVPALLDISAARLLTLRMARGTLVALPTAAPSAEELAEAAAAAAAPTAAPTGDVGDRSSQGGEFKFSVQRMAVTLPPLAPPAAPGQRRAGGAAAGGEASPPPGTMRVARTTDLGRLARAIVACVQDGTADRCALQPLAGHAVAVAMAAVAQARRLLDEGGSEWDVGVLVSSKRQVVEAGEGSGKGAQKQRTHLQFVLRLAPFARQQRAAQEAGEVKVRRGRRRPTPAGAASTATEVGATEAAAAGAAEAAEAAAEAAEAEAAEAAAEAAAATAEP